jgi:hypothetical protein
MIANNNVDVDNDDMTARVNRHAACNQCEIMSLVGTQLGLEFHK